MLAPLRANSTADARDGNATRRRTGSAWIGGVTLLRLPLGLSFAGHTAALALAAWLGSPAPSIPDQFEPQTIPLIFIEPSPVAAQAVQSDQAALTTPSATASEPLEANEQRPTSALALQQTRLPEQAGPAPPVASAFKPAEAPPTSASAEQASAPEDPAEEPIAITQEQPPPLPARKSVAPPENEENSEVAAKSVSHAPDSASAAPSQVKPPRLHNPAGVAAPAPSTSATRKPPAVSDAGPPVARRDAPPTAVPPRAPAATQIAAVPPPAAPPAAVAPTANPPPQISTEYRFALSTWLERHKVYPAAARQRGEQGSAVLRFRVRRDGRVLAYQLVRSTGHAALDAAVDEMMRGATLPPFPASMTQPEIAVSVPIRFSLSG
jgi:protein TonB